VEKVIAHHLLEKDIHPMVQNALHLPRINSKFF
jgi:hypothetical protein